MKKVIGAVLVFGVMGVALLLLGVLVAGGTYFYVGGQPDVSPEQPGLEAVLGAARDAGEGVVDEALVAEEAAEPTPAPGAPKPSTSRASKPSPSPASTSAPRPTVSPRPAPQPAPAPVAPAPEPEPDPVEHLPEDEAESLDEVMNDFVIEDLDTEPESRKRRKR